MKLKGYIYALISTLLYASIGVFVKNGISQEFSQIDLVMLQNLLTIVIMFIVCITRYKNELKVSKTMLKKLFILGGIANTLMLVCNYTSYKYLSITIATVILYTYPAILAIASYIIFKNKISKNKVFAIAGTFLGCLMVINIFSKATLSQLNFNGVAFAFLAAIAFAFMNMYASTILETVSPPIVTFYNSIFSTLVLLIFNFKFVFKLQYITLPLLNNTLMLTVFCGILPSILFYAALKHIGPIPTSIIGTLEIPFAALISFFIMNDSLSAVQILGIIVSLLSVILLRFEKSTVSKENLKSEIKDEVLE